MKSKKQTVFVQVLAFFTATLSVIFLRQYYQGKAGLKNSHSAQSHFPPAPQEIFLESSEVLLDEEFDVKPIDD